MNFTSETGTFATVTGLSINSSEHFNLTYEATDVLLTVASGPLSPPLWTGRQTPGLRAGTPLAVSGQTPGLLSNGTPALTSHVMNVDFAGVDGNKAQRLSRAPRFDRSQSGNANTGQRTRTMINIRDSGQLLSMLDHTVPGSDGRLAVSHHNRMNDAGKTDRMMRADRGMAATSRMSERAATNPRVGAGKRAL
jgi:hypothetical protein